jgi:hypothetical protein
MSDPQRRHGPFSPMTRGAARAFVALSAVTMFLALTGFLWTAAAVNAANARARAQCHFDAHLGGAPLTVNPKTGKAALLGVQIISDARVAFRQAGCEGRLPPADPSFLHWAAYYKLPAG